MDVRKIGQSMFASLEAAQELYDSLERQGFDYISIVSNASAKGELRVSWGHYVESTETRFEYELRMLAKIRHEREQEAADEFTTACNTKGRCLAGQQLADASGLEGRDAEVFCFGFCGHPAKFVDPRAEGREPIFRAGRAAWGGKEGQRLWKIESVKARSVLTPALPQPFNYGGLIANGEH